MSLDSNGRPNRDANASQAQRLEQLMTAACRAQPLLSAPAGLHARVMAAIERRAHEWWRAPLPAWPKWAQAALLLLCLCCIWLATGSTWFAGSEGAIQQWLFMPWMLADIFSSLLAVLQHLSWLMLSISPALWLAAVFAGGVAVAAGVMGLSRLTARHA